MYILFSQQVICRKNIYTTPRLSSDMLLVHRDSKENNSKIPFQFTEANMKVRYKHTPEQPWDRSGPEV